MRYFKRMAIESNLTEIICQAINLAHDWISIDHFRLEYGANNTNWSQKDSMFWSFAIGLHDRLFKDLKIRDTELAFYQTKVNQCDLPLDN